MILCGFVMEDRPFSSLLLQVHQGMASYTIPLKKVILTAVTTLSTCLKLLR